MPTTFVTSLPAPSNLTLSFDGDVNISWTNNDNSSDGGIDVERSTDGFSTVTTVASSLSPTTTSYTDTTVSGGITYEYRVERNTDHTSSTSDAKTIETGVAPPSNLSISVTTEGELDLDWTDNADQEDGFYVYRSETSGSATADYTQIDTLGVNTSSYTDSGLEDGEKYFYRVSSYDQYGESNLTNEVSATTILPSPYNISFDDSINGELTISWTNGDNSSDGNIEIERAPLVGSDWSTITSNLSVSTKTYTDTSINDSDEYKYRISRITDHSTVTNQKAYKFYPRLNIV